MVEIFGAPECPGQFTPGIRSQLLADPPMTWHGKRGKAFTDLIPQRIDQGSLFMFPGIDAGNDVIAPRWVRTGNTKDQAAPNNREGMEAKFEGSRRYFPASHVDEIIQTSQDANPFGTGQKLHQVTGGEHSVLKARSDLLRI